MPRQQQQPREPQQPDSGPDADVANGERPVEDPTEHRTGEQQAQENRENDPPA